jgi:hypothetical protein
MRHVSKRPQFKLLTTGKMAFDNREVWQAELYQVNENFRSQIRCERNGEVMYFSSKEGYDTDSMMSFEGFHYQHGISQLYLSPDLKMRVVDDKGNPHLGSWVFG